MRFNEGIAAIEAILFASGDPIEAEKIAEATDIETENVIKMIEVLNDRYKERESALVVGKLGGCYQLMTRTEYSAYIKAALENRRQAPLTQAAMEVLAIVAYNQPVTRSFIEQVRGVDSSGVVKSLTERNLLEEYGRLEDVPGKPIAYKTTENFLRCFGVESLGGLPEIPDDSGQIHIEQYEEMLEEQNAAAAEEESDSEE